VREERFRLALERARRELERGAEREGPARLSALLDHVRAGSVEGPRTRSSASRCARAIAS
jgi:hypothetical protein